MSFLLDRSGSTVKCKQIGKCSTTIQETKTDFISIVFIKLASEFTLIFLIKKGIPKKTGFKHDLKTH